MNWKIYALSVVSLFLITLPLGKDLVTAEVYILNIGINGLALLIARK